MNYEKLAELLFPHIDKTPADYEAMYPARDLPAGAKVTRLGPSPTGFIHLGNLYGAFVDERLAHQSGGKFFLRIEDTDDKRYVEGAVEIIINSLRFFGIQFDEGATMNGDIGDYGDYTQSHRGPIYQCFAKKLVAEGKAYPCFMTEADIAEIHAQQEAQKANPGIYGKWAKSRDLSMEEIEAKLAAGTPYVIRLKSDGDMSLPEDQIKRFQVEDAIRGTLDMPVNDQDTVLLKATGIPTYHFAHVVDDHLMRTTHVVRGAEWLPSLPIHVELFEKLGWEVPIYCHTAQLMKLDEEGNKRKLSKRKDPELSLDYYRNEGYHPAAVREYLLTILNSNFEEWRIANPDAPIDDFAFTTEKMSNSGALFDLNKLNDISNAENLADSRFFNFNCLFDHIYGSIDTEYTAVQAQVVAVYLAPAFAGVVIVIARTFFICFDDTIFCFCICQIINFCNSSNTRLQIRVEKYAETVIKICQCIIRATTDHDTRSLSCDFLDSFKLSQENFLINWHIRECR